MSLRKTVFAILVLSFALYAGAASAGDRWLHVKVDEGGRHGERVRVQIPLKMIKAMLPLIDTDEFHDGRVYIGHDRMDSADIRAMLAALDEAEDGEYVRVEGRDELVRVAKRGEFLHVKVQEQGDWDDEEIVNIRLPMVVVRAMLTSDTDELDVAAAIDALDGLGKLELVTVDDGDSRVRVWIDERHEDLDDQDL